MKLQGKTTPHTPGTSYIRKPLGEVLIEAGLVTAHQIAVALQEQKDCGLKLGEILALRGWIDQQTADFFVEKWSKAVSAREKKPLVVYFLQAGLLDKQQVKHVMYLQKHLPDKVRFHRLIVDKGYIKQITVDYFLANLFDIHTSKVFSFTKPYEVIKSYTDGKTNFKNSQLAGAPLKGVTLKSVHLDGSNLQDADLEASNLSHSSLSKVNLSNANLYKSTLTEANFRDSCLTKANFKESCLQGAVFDHANLQNADLDNAYLLKTWFLNADLRGAKLPAEYPYDVYYNEQTLFDSSFDPLAAGWIKRELTD